MDLKFSAVGDPSDRDAVAFTKTLKIKTLLISTCFTMFHEIKSKKTTTNFRWTYTRKPAVNHHDLLCRFPGVSECVTSSFSIARNNF